MIGEKHVVAIQWEIKHESETRGVSCNRQEAI